PMPQKNQGFEVRSTGVEVIGASGYCFARALATMVRPVVLPQAQDERGRGISPLGVSLSNHERATTHEPYRHLCAFDADYPRRCRAGWGLGGCGVPRADIAVPPAVLRAGRALRGKRRGPPQGAA